MQSILTMKNNHTHAIMFHHFHDKHHPEGQGSLSAEQFSDMLDWLQDRYNLLNVNEYIFKLKCNALQNNDICLTFDDALLCQADIALPILNKRKIQAFFFIYSSPFMGEPDYLEIYRYFRMTEFQDINDFYKHFFEKTKFLYTSDYEDHNKKFQDLNYLNDFKFYTADDKWFRYLRDIVLGKNRYEDIMSAMMKEYNFSPQEKLSSLWMNNNHLKSLQSGGHNIGLHSYSHPTTLHFLDRNLQENEYSKNFLHLSDILGDAPQSMSHPCGNYNDDTLKILNKKNIEIGFRSSNSIKEIKSHLEIPREDHANILKEMQK